MSETADHPPRSDDAAAYVLGALDGHEASEFRAHIASCESCAEEVGRFAAAAAMLPLAAPQIKAPAKLRRRVIGEARREQRAGAQSRGWRPARRFELVGAGALAVGLALGALLLAPGTPGTTVIRAQVAAVSVWHTRTRPVAWLDRSGSDATLVVEDLPQAPAGKVYELWVERGGRPRPTDALFEPTSGGRAEAVVPGGVAGASAVLVTAERRGGAEVPTMAPLIHASLQA
jgi:anti-sigma-K factor RskA